MSVSASASSSSSSSVRYPPASVCIIGGTSFLHSDAAASLLRDQHLIHTPFGDVRVHTGRISVGDGEADGDIQLVFIQRHQCDPGTSYSPPHAIPHKAIFHAIKSTFGVKAVVALGSTGSLQSHVRVGDVMIPDDYYSLNDVHHFAEDASAHIVPGFDSGLRDSLIQHVKTCVLDATKIHSTGVYVQTRGPRFETKAEVRALSCVGDIVGMTCATEATLAKELSIPYAVVCCVDNMAHGLVNEELSYDAFKKSVHSNEDMAALVLKAAIACVQEVGTATATLASSEGSNDASSPPNLEQAYDRQTTDASDVTLNSSTSSRDIARSTDDVREPVDTIVQCRWIVPIRPHHVLEHHSIVVNKGLIVSIVPHEEALSRFAASEVIDRKLHHVAMPGLINAHTHLGMTGMRGLADDLSLMDWLSKHIWPVEHTLAGAEFCKDGTELGLCELIRSGTTCVNDMYFHPEATAKVIDEIGFRGVVGAILLDFPTGYGSGAHEYLEKGERLHSEWKDHDRVYTSCAPHAPYTVGDENLIKLGAVSQTRQTPFHVHLHETANEVHHSTQLMKESPCCHRSDQSMSPLQNFDRLGLVNKHLVAVHMTELGEQDIDILEQNQASVVHCPMSNLKLASGLCPVATLLSRGINVALGTDSAASNNQLDMFAELKMAALLGKGVASDPQVVSAKVALEMATINGAKALALDDKIGSLEPGKYADMITLDFSDISLVPVYDVISHLCYSCTGNNVCDVWVEGKILMKERQLTTLDIDHVKKKAIEWSRQIHSVLHPLVRS